MLKGFFANHSALFQTGVLIYLFLFGLLLSTVLTSGVERAFGFQSVPLDSLSVTSFDDLSFYKIHLIQFCSDLFLFLSPAVLTAYLCSKTPGFFLCLHKIKDIRVFILTILMMICLSPAIEITAFLNSKLILPDFMAPIENWLRQYEDLAKAFTERLLSAKGVIHFIVNMFVIAVLAGLAEEFLFRGALLTIVRKKISNPHVAIWLVAILFSAIHFQFYGFVPRMLLGGVLGYLLVWTKSIWIPVFAHFFNNAVAVTVSYTKIDHPFISGLDSTHQTMKSEDWIIYIAISITGILLFFLFAKKVKKNNG